MRAATRSLVTAVLLLAAAAPGAAARGLVDDVNPFVGHPAGGRRLRHRRGSGQHLPGGHHAVRDGGVQPRLLARHRPLHLQLRGHPAARLLAHPFQRRGLRDLRRRAAAAHHRGRHPLAAGRKVRSSIPPSPRPSITAASTPSRAATGSRSIPARRVRSPASSRPPRAPAPGDSPSRRARAGTMLVNAGGSSSGNTAVRVAIDPARREVSGMVESGGFCAEPTKYRVYFSARFNQRFAAQGTWSGPDLRARDAKRAVPAGGGAYVSFGSAWAQRGGARGDLLRERGRRAGQPGREPRAQLRTGARRRPPDLGPGARARAGGWRPASDRRVFATSLYHSLLEPSVFSDRDGRYPGMDGRVHRARGFVKYADISGWDVYRSQTQLMAMLFPAGRPTWPPRCWPTPARAAACPAGPTRTSRPT